MDFSRLKKLAGSEEKLDKFASKLSEKLNIAPDQFEKLKNVIRRQIAKRIDGAAPAKEAAPAAEAAAPAASASAKPVHSSSSAGGSSNEFLWKPQSESNGNLVVLLPSSLTGNIDSVEVLGPNGEPLATGSSAGVANGGREHFRFNKPGGSFPNGSSVRVTLRDGRTMNIPVGNTASRNTSNGVSAGNASGVGAAVNQPAAA